MPSAGPARVTSLGPATPFVSAAVTANVASLLAGGSDPGANVWLDGSTPEPFPPPCAASARSFFCSIVGEISSDMQPQQHQTRAGRPNLHCKIPGQLSLLFRLAL